MREWLKEVSSKMDPLCLNLSFSVKVLNYIVALEVSCWNKYLSLVLRSSHDLPNKTPKVASESSGVMWLQNWEHICRHLDGCYVVYITFSCGWQTNLCLQIYRWVSVWEGSVFCFVLVAFLCGFFLLVLENCPCMCIYFLQATAGNLQLTTSRLWNESSLKWVRTWAKKPNAMLFLHCLFFQGHARSGMTHHPKH